MTAILTIEEAQSKLREIIGHLAPGDEIVITDNEQAVAKLVSEPAKSVKRTRPGPGLCKGIITYMAPDFNAPLEDFKEYIGTDTEFDAYGVVRLW
jgi:antitoxin (DNA-binding transcriptional repressor) of toxin-antitoxin stability system